MTRLVLPSALAVAALAQTPKLDSLHESFDIRAKMPDGITGRNGTKLEPAKPDEKNCNLNVSRDQVTGQNADSAQRPDAN